MLDDRLYAALRPIVEQYGYSSVNRALRELRSIQNRTEYRNENAASPPKNTKPNNKKRTLNAVEYVFKMDLPSERKSILAQAAERFQHRMFLPTIGDIRHFWEVYGIECQIPSSRAAAIPRVFKFMSSMDPKEVARILDTRAFSGPARLGQIAEAIEKRGRQRLHNSRFSMQNLPDADTPSK